MKALCIKETRGCGKLEQTSICFSSTTLLSIFTLILICRSVRHRSKFRLCVCVYVCVFCSCCHLVQFLYSVLSRSRTPALLCSHLLHFLHIKHIFLIWKCELLVHLCTLFKPLLILAFLPSSTVFFSLKSYLKYSLKSQINTIFSFFLHQCDLITCFTFPFHVWLSGYLNIDGENCVRVHKFIWGCTGLSF